MDTLKVYALLILALAIFAWIGWTYSNPNRADLNHATANQR